MGALKVFVIAGEASGDRLGAALMAGLAQLGPVDFRGVGGSAMQGQGLASLFAMEELSVMGLAEVLPKYLHLKRRIAEVAQAVLDWQPDVLITIDSPDFCLRVAALVKQAAPIRVVHYVAPSVWAWRPGRARRMLGRVDQVLALLPFEPPLMRAAGLACDFVGHPVVAEPQADAAAAAAFRARHRIGPGPMVLALPGSRRGELRRLMPVFGQTLGLLRDSHPGLKVVLPTLAHLAAEVASACRDWPVPALILDPAALPPEAAAAEKRAAFAAADVALAASGTVSLELAAAGTPMVIAYDMNPISRLIIGAMLRIDTVTLVNLVSDTRAVPEFIGRRCRAGLIAPAVLDVLRAGDAQRQAMALTMDRLGRGQEAPGLRAARAVRRGLGLPAEL